VRWMTRTTCPGTPPSAEQLLGEARPGADLLRDVVHDDVDGAHALDDAHAAERALLGQHHRRTAGHREGLPGRGEHHRLARVPEHVLRAHHAVTGLEGEPLGDGAARLGLLAAGLPGAARLPRRPAPAGTASRRPAAGTRSGRRAAARDARAHTSPTRSGPRPAPRPSAPCALRGRPCPRPRTPRGSWPAREPGVRGQRPSTIFLRRSPATRRYAGCSPNVTGHSHQVVQTATAWQPWVVPCKQRPENHSM
jgi:hypothetical protein